MATATSERTQVVKTGAKDRLWELRAWSGMGVTGWIRALARNRFAITPTRVPMAVVITIFSFFNTFFALVQTLLFGRRIARTDLVDSPIFVLGHWRSGTTLLHEMLVCDPRHTYADTFACFGPTHFLVTRAVLSWPLRPFAPKQRPMDNMVITWQHPQEDEWALCNMGLPTTYLTMLFPNHKPQYQEYLDLREVPHAARERWKRKFLWFLKCLTVQSPRRIVLKSPHHTCRIRTLLEMFPEARFVHIARSPWTIFESTRHTWRRMYKYQGLQSPKYEGLDEHILSTFRRMYDVFEEDRALLDSSQFCEVRYEDLVDDPIGQIRMIYSQLGLGPLEPALPAVEKYVAKTADYKTNVYRLSKSVRDEIANRWGDFAERYGYEPPDGDA